MNTGKGRWETVRNLLSRRQIAETVSLTPQPGIRNSALAGFQVALTALIALPLVHLSPYAGLIGFASLGSLVALFGRFAPKSKRGWVVFLCLLCQTSTVFIMSTVAYLGAPMLIQLLVLAVLCGVLFYIANKGEFGPPGALIFIFAASVSMGHVASAEQVIERTLATGAAAVLALIICLLTEVFRHSLNGGAKLSETQRPLTHQLIAVARIIAGSALAAYSAYALGGPHAGWAAMGAVAVLQGAHLHITMSRALQRTGGNVLGAVLVALILGTDPSIWTVILLVAFLSFATEVIIGANYGLGQILVTPMALLMSYLAAPDSAGITMAEERVLNTLIGAAIGLVLAVVFSTLDDRAYLAQYHETRMK